MGHRNIANLRNFLIEYANKNGLDHLLPDTWYNIPYNEVIQFKVNKYFLLLLLLLRFILILMFFL